MFSKFVCNARTPSIHLICAGFCWLLECLPVVHIPPIFSEMSRIIEIHGKCCRVRIENINRIRTIYTTFVSFFVQFHYSVHCFSFIFFLNFHCIVSKMHIELLPNGLFFHLRHLNMAGGHIFRTNERYFIKTIITNRIGYCCTFFSLSLSFFRFYCIVRSNSNFFVEKQFDMAFNI